MGDCKKVENGRCFFVKKWKMFFFVKSGPFLNAGCIMHSISTFLFYILLIWAVRKHTTYPLPTGLDWGVMRKENVAEGRGIIEQKFYRKRAELSCAGCAQRDRPIGGQIIWLGEKF